MSFMKKFSKKKQLALLIALFSLLSLSPSYSPAEISKKLDQQKNIWTIVGEKSQLEVDLTNSRIQEQIQFYAKRPHTLNTITDQAEPYLHVILSEIEKRDLPYELLLLPIMESAYETTISSHKGASGLWQFMPRTAKYVGMKLDWWYDGRHDIQTSTEKAMEYMTYLVKRFNGDWALAAAAYDSGEGTVMRAIKKNKAAGKKADYWSLDLPTETKKYVPRLLALAEIFSHPKKYGLNLNHVDNKPFLKRIDLGRQMSLVKVADLAKLDLAALTDLNPGYKKLVTAPKGPHMVMVPVENAPILEESLARLTKDDHRSWFKYHVAQGDSLKTLADRYDTSESMILQINRLAHNVSLKPGIQLALPTALTQKLIPTKPIGTQKMVYSISKNDSFWTISKKFQVKLSDLKKWNPKINSDKLMIGDELALFIPAKKTVAQSLTLPAVHTVVSGDSLSVIAHRYQTNVESIKAMNNLKSNTLQIGQTLHMQSLTT